MRKQKRLAVLTSIGPVILPLVLVVSGVFATHASTYATAARNGLINTINGLSRIAVVGNTAFIVDAHGRTIAVDPNPYGVTIVPSSIPASNTPGTLKAGDILVSNIGDNDTVAVAHL